MADIEVAPRRVGKATLLVTNTAGWHLQDTRFNLDTTTIITGNPNIVSQTPEDLRDSLERAWLLTQEQRPMDINGPKVAVSRITLEKGILSTECQVPHSSDSLSQ